jgi:hypothetical protein
MAGARHGICELTWHGRGTAWVQHGMCELAFKWQLPKNGHPSVRSLGATL